MRRLLFWLVAVCGVLALATESAGAGSLLVTTTADSGPGSLRQAILDANASPGLDTITFDPAVFPPGSPAMITPTDELPEIDATEGITIDGTGAGVILDGSNAGSFGVGLTFGPSDANLNDIVLREFAVRDFDSDNIEIDGANVSRVTIANVASTTTTDPFENVDIDADALTGVMIEGGEISGASFQVLDIDAGEISGLVITDVLLRGPGSQVLEISASGTMSDVEVRDNTITDGDGFEHVDISGATIQGLTIAGNSVTGGDDVSTGVDIAAMSINGLTMTDNTISDATFQGVNVRATGPAADISLTSNNISDNGRQAIQMSAPLNGMFSDVRIENNTMTGNLVGAGPVGRPGTLDISGATSGPFVVSGNSIRDGGGRGIKLTGSSPGDPMEVTISRNSISGNTDIGIDLVALTDTAPGVTPNDAGDGDAGPNTLLNFPEWQVAVGYEVAPGTACPDCLVEVFKADGDPSGHGEGEIFLGDTLADETGFFSFNICGVSAGEEITATATDADGNTSEFSENYTALEDAPPCLPVNGDTDCDGDVDGRDALGIAVADSGAAPLSQEDGCPAIGSDLAQPASEATGPDIFGDVNCSGAVDGADVLAVLRHAAGLPPDPPQPAACVAISEPHPPPGGV